jgi:flagellar biosynthesis GTPase FlhF
VKRRKDAVLAIEYLVTASPEWFRTAPAKQQNAYFAAAVRWLETRHGKANIVCVNMQLDETSPHLVAYVVPLTKDGRLSAKDFLGGRKVLTQMQTEFAEHVGKPAGLQRGVEGSKATHTTAKQYAAALQKNPTLAPPAAPAPTIADRITGRAKQMEEEHAAAQAEHLALVEQARNVAAVNRRARAQQATALEQLRQDAEEVKRHEAEAARLREENRRLKRELQEERTYFQQQIANLKVALAKAVDQVKSLLQKIGVLTRERDRAEADAEALREILYPVERRSRAEPGNH